MENPGKGAVSLWQRKQYNVVVLQDQLKHEDRESLQNADHTIAIHQVSTCGLFTVWIVDYNFFL